MSASKACITCGEFKPIDDFYRHRMMADGHLNSCRDCVKARTRRHRSQNIDRIREYDRMRSRKPDRIALRLKTSADYIKNFPDRRIATSAVYTAIKAGTLTALPCHFCGKIKTEAHHHDYSKPLDVTWLCRKCHQKFHGLERMSTYSK